MYSPSASGITFGNSVPANVCMVPIGGAPVLFN